jgi:fibronectin-binding autotransporter adhesin
MKTRFPITASILVIFLTHAPAATFSWDTLAGDSALTGGSGSWDTTTALWSEDNGITNVPWPSTSSGNDDAVFGGTGGVVTIAAGGITANDITFQVGDYTIAGEPLTLDGTTPTITANANATISSAIAGSAGLSKTGAGNLTLGGVNTYTGTTAISAGTLVLGMGASLDASGLVSFTGTSGLNLGGNSQTLANLSISAVAANNTASLTNGSLTLNGASALTIAPGVTTGGRTAEIDASALASLTVSKPSQTITVGGTSGGTSPGNYGIWKLSGSSNTITASSLNIGTTGAANASGVLNNGRLDLGTSNVIHVDNCRLGTTRDAGVMQFQTGLTNPSITMRGQNGTSAVTSIVVGDNGAGSTGVGTSQMNLSAGAVDILATTMILSRGASVSTTTAGPSVNGAFSMGAGTLTLTNLWMSRNEGGGLNGALSGASNTSTFAQFGGSVNVNTITLAQTTATTPATGPSPGGQVPTFNAQYTIHDGTLRAGSITAGTGIFSSSTVRRINFNGGIITTLDANSDLTINGVTGTGGSIGLVLGTSGSPTLNVPASRTITVGANTATSGSGSLTKTGEGTLVMNAANTYTGDTRIIEGSLTIGNGGALAGSALNLPSEDAGTISFNGTTTINLGGLKGTRDLSLLNQVPASQSLTIGNAFNHAYSGVLSGVTSAIAKVGAGTQTMSGSNNWSLASFQSRGGVFEFNNGTMAITGSGSTTYTAGMNGFTVVGNSTFRLNGGTVNITGGNYVYTAGHTGGGAGAFTLNSGTFNAGNLEILNAYGAGGTTTINGGLLICGTFRVAQSTGNLNLNGGIARVNAFTTGGGTSSINFNGGTAQARVNTAAFIASNITNARIQANGAVIDTNGVSITIPKALTEDANSTGGGLTKTGDGLLTLTAANTYTGATRVNHGELRVNVDHTTATGSIIVGDSEGDAGTAILSGNGIMGGAITVNTDGAIAPGAGVGQLTTAFNVGGNGALIMEVNGAASDKLQLTGSGTIDITNLKLQLSVASTPTETSYVLIDAATAITGAAFASVEGLPSGYQLVYDNVLHEVRMEQIPPSASYAVFAETITDVTKRARLDDADGDGINNLLEYTLGGNPNIADQTILPAFSQTETNVIFTFKRSDSSETDVTQAFQWSINLQDWNDIVLGATSSANVEIVENDANHDDVTVTIPKAGNTKIFGRLKVTTP